MGDKRASIRTLPSGEKVRHLPPSSDHPEGEMVLIRDRSPLRERLEANLAENKRRHAALQHRHLRRVAIKKQRQAAKGMPPEKSSC